MQNQFSRGRAASKSNFISLVLQGLSAVIFILLCAGSPAQNLGPTNFRVNNITVNGPATLANNNQLRNYTVSFDIQRLHNFHGAVDVIVWLMDDDSHEAFRDGDDYLSFVRVHVTANQTHKNVVLQLKGFQMKVFGTATHDPAGNANDNDSGEGGPSWFGPNPAEIYASIAGFRSGVMNVTVH